MGVYKWVLGSRLAVVPRAQDLGFRVCKVWGSGVIEWVLNAAVSRLWA